MQRKIYEALVSWKNSPQRQPLLLYGARQVGKTYLLTEFAKKEYRNYVYFNLELNLEVAKLFEDNIDITQLLSYLEALAQQRIIPGETLVIFDEIQAEERALLALKYFSEQAPTYHIAAAGSLLGVALNRSKYSFPVGKINSYVLYPLDFEEFLWACGADGLHREILGSFAQMCAMPIALHQRGMELFKHYLMVGGMPKAVIAYLEEGSFLAAREVQTEIVRNYIADMSKYTSSGEEIKIKACYNSLPVQLAKDNKKFQYKLVQRGGTATIFGSSLDWLEQAGLILRCTKVLDMREPLNAYRELSSFKIYGGDIGLLAAQSGLSQSTVLGTGENIFMGAIVENYVAQQLIAMGKPLFYWQSAYTAEVDFILQEGNAILGMEVKRGEHSKSKSLSVFAEQFQPPYSYRVSGKNFGEENKIKSLPLYALWCLDTARK